MSSHKRFRALLLAGLLTLLPGMLAAADRDVGVFIYCSSILSGRHQANTSYSCNVQVTNYGPAALAAGALKVVVRTYDHTGQHYLKTVGTKDIPALASGAKTIVVDFGDTSAAGTFFYKAGISAAPKYYTDTKNSNNTDMRAVIFYNP